MARYGDLDTQYFNDAGDPLVNGKIFFYETGTTTPKTTFADVNFTIPNPNPVILTAAGRQPNIFFQGVAKAILATSAGVQILVRDPVGETAATFGNPWLASKDYNANDVVQGSNGDFYVSLINGNVNNNPVTTTGSWTFLYSVEWSQGTTYKAGSVVTYETIVYQSLQNANLNQNPSTQTAFWVPIQLAYLATQTYAIHANVVGTDGILYTSLQNANTGNTPASSPTYWVGTSAAAAASATAAAASASAASTSATNAAASASTATTQATNAATSASNASTSASNAATSATNAAASESSAASSASSATSSASSATSSASSATSSASAASTSATNAANSATAASGSASTATTQASNALTSANNAATSETNAATSASNAATSATTATTQASNASTSATNAATSATNAASSASAASGSASAAAASFDTFDDRYLGAKTSDPTLDNDGNALLTGAQYFNSVLNVTRVYNGAAWQDTALTATTAVSTFLNTPSSANLAAAVTDETGTGALVFANSPTLVTPALGTPASGVVTNLTGTASININGTVGATTPAAGAFTTVSATGLISATVGGATCQIEVFPGVSYIGTTTAQDVVIIRGSVGIAGFSDTGLAVTGTITASAGTAALPAITPTGDTNTGVFFPAADTIAASTAGSERLRITSAGDVGIGTSSPQRPLDVNGSVRLSSGSVIEWGGTVTNFITGNNSSNYVAIGTNSTERLRIDSSGNLGLGVTPSAWDSIFKVYQLGQTGVVAGRSDTPAAQIQVGSNFYYDGADFRYITSSFAHRYLQNNGAHSWDVAASGTAGNTITFTQAMTLSAAGGLSVGTTTDAGAGNLRVAGTVTIAVNATGALGPELRLDNTTGDVGDIEAITFVSGGAGNERAQIRSTVEGSPFNGNLEFLTGNGTLTPRMTITGAGNVGIGTTTPQSDANYNFITLNDTTGSGMVMRTGGTNQAAVYALSATAYYDAVTSHRFRAGAVFGGSEIARIDSDGLKFNGDTAAANALDDYEQGTWTPTVAGDTVAGTYELSLAQAIYTKIGNLVTVCCQVTLAGSVTGGGTGEFNITGLPFAANSDSNRSQRGTASTSGVEIAAGKTFLVSAPAAIGSTRMVLLACGDGVAQSLVPMSAVGVNDNIVVQMTYFT